MNARQLWLLTIAALGVITAAIWVGLARNPATEQSTALYPALRDQIAKVHAVQIFKAGDQLTVDLTRSATGWTVKQRFGYPADTQKVNSLLLSLADAKLREEKTRNPDNYATLGVQELASQGATGARIELAGAEPSVKLIVGKSDAAARATYVRRAGEPQSWLVSEQFTTPTDVTEWLSRNFLNVGADRIQEVAVNVDGSPNYSAVKTKAADANFDVTPIPKKRELNSVGAANSVAQSLMNLQLDDVRPAAELANTKDVAHASFRTFDGLVIDVTGYSAADKQWITVKARFDAELAKRFHAPDAAVETGKKAAQEAETIGKQTSEWAYAIAAYKYDAIFKPIEQLLRKP